MMIKAYIKYWKKALQYQGYSKRSDYWWVILINVIIAVVFTILKSVVTVPKVNDLIKNNPGDTQNLVNEKTAYMMEHPTGSLLVIAIISAIVTLVLLIPNFTLTARRLRDAGFFPWLAIFGSISSLFSVGTSFGKFPNIGMLGWLFSIISLVIWILCIFDTRYKDDEDEDTRNYD